MHCYANYMHYKIKTKFSSSLVLNICNYQETHRTICSNKYIKVFKNKYMLIQKIKMEGPKNSLVIFYFLYF